MHLMDYEDIFSDNNQTFNLLLGNGFSIAYKKSFGNIKEQIRFNSIDNDKFNSIVNQKQLENEQAKVANNMKVQCGSITKPSRIMMDYDKVKLEIFEDVARNLPNGICKILPQEAKCCLKFLNPFLRNGNKVFTLNYDLLLYWAVTKALYSNSDCKVNTNDSCLYNDGFEESDSHAIGWKWHSDEMVNVFYCHGAINLYQYKGECRKLAHDQLCLEPLRIRFQNKKNIKNAVYICEKTSKTKYNEITKYKYLQTCFDILSNISGCLVIFGFACNENDVHVLKAIANAQENNNLKVYYGLYENSKFNEINEIFLKSNINASFFDSNTVEVWKKNKRILPK